MRLTREHLERQQNHCARTSKPEITAGIFYIRLSKIGLRYMLHIYVYNGTVSALFQPLSLQLPDSFFTGNIAFNPIN